MSLISVVHAGNIKLAISDRPTINAMDTNTRVGPGESHNGRRMSNNNSTRPSKPGRTTSGLSRRALVASRPPGIIAAGNARFMSELSRPISPRVAPSAAR